MDPKASAAPAYNYPAYPDAGGYPVNQQPTPYGGPQPQQQPAQYYGGQQQQPPPGGNTVVVVQQHNEPTQSFVGHIVFACVVFWCCGWICGLVAFILAMVAMDRASSGDKDSARGLGHASMAFSVVGLLIGLAIIIYLIVVYAILVVDTHPIVQQPPQYVGGPQQQEQQQAINTTVVVASQHNTPARSFVGHIVFACLVFCGCLCGLIAFIPAVEID